LEYVQNTVVNAPVTFKEIVYSDIDSKFFFYSEIINCNFNRLYGMQYAAFTASWSYVRVANEYPPSSMPNQMQLYTISNNLVDDRGIIGVDKQTFFSIENLVFINNTSKLKASALRLGSEAFGNVSNTLFLSNNAVFGTVVIESGSKVNLVNCTFERNYAIDSSGFYA